MEKELASVLVEVETELEHLKANQQTENRYNNNDYKLKKKALSKELMEVRISLGILKDNKTAKANPQ